MESFTIFADGSGDQTASVMQEAMAFAKDQELTKKEALRLRLLSEEMLGLLSGITNNNFDSMFWIEGEYPECWLHLKARIDMTADARSELLASSTSGKNAAAVGLGGKIRDMITAGILELYDPTIVSDETSAFFFDAGTPDFESEEDSTTWNLSRYRETISELYDEGNGYADGGSPDDDYEPMQELERSVIANLADDVSVSIQNNNVEIVVYKVFG